MEDLRVGEGVDSRKPKGLFSCRNLFGDCGSRPCQNNRGEELVSEALNGDDWNGDESPLSTIFCGQH
jgi:hypothetical protein